jgi:hypothetical protein
VGTFVQVTGDTIALTLRDSAARYDLAATVSKSLGAAARTGWWAPAPASSWERA